MCGIVGYVGYKPAQDVLLGGLEKLEYRGYDSAGISLMEDGELRSVRAVGNLSKLREAVASLPPARAPSPSRSRPAPPASATPAGPRMAASARRTPTRTSTWTTASTSSSTA